MDLGVVAGMNGLLGSSSEGGGGHFSSPMASSGHETIRQMGLFGSGFLKQGRSSGAPEEELDWRCPKMGRTETMLLNSTKTSRSNCHSLYPEGQQMLSFSSTKPDASLLRNDGTLPYYLTSSSVSPSSASYFRNAGMVYGSLNMNMHGVLTGIRGPFTPSQWVELEHQVLIYKYIDANVPIPSNLLISIRKSLNPSGFSGYSAASLRPTPLGWGGFQLGFSGNSDPEPGRCRRTDGKKWRCSRDAVADQKYCERHINRGRHRSRKPVEAQTGHVTTPSPQSAAAAAASAVSGGGGSSNGPSIIAQHKASQPVSTRLPPNQFNRIPLNKENGSDRLLDPEILSMPTSINPSKPKETLFPIPKQNNLFEESSAGAEFGLIISSDSLLNPPRSFHQSDQEPQHHHPLRHFFDDWPKNRSDQSPINWEVEEIHSDRTQLSISIPVESSDISSSSPSPTTQGRLALSPLKLAREFDPIHMGLGLGGTLNEVNRRQASWIPISWETSMGGPLGEVLKNTNSVHTSASALNLMSERCDSSPPLGSSPTGVLQKATFASVSSSTGSSPRTENPRAQDSTSSLCDDIFGSTLVCSTSIPNL